MIKHNNDIRTKERGKSLAKLKEKILFSSAVIQAFAF